ncbi:MAG: autotransporter-associated beta strand repeat-containing protein, partial [Akkermansia sp.]|nr:autotransporter-associated beta strand repeat-containing protein [Akkermansia sp.]
MKLHLNLTLRRALLAAMAAVATFASSVTAGIADARYDLQYYLDFAYNMGMFRPGASNLTVAYKDGTTVSDPVIPVMPNLDSFGTKGDLVGYNFYFQAGSGLVAPQYLVSAAHCNESPVFFVTQNMTYRYKYTSSGYASRAGVGSADWSIQRLNKIVTEVAYTPYASDEFMASLPANETWLYRAGQGDPKDTNGGLSIGRNAMGGLINISNINKNGTGTWVFTTHLREYDVAGDTRPPLEIGVTAGDSGSAIYAWDDENDRFLHVGFASGSTNFDAYSSNGYFCHNGTAYENFIDSYDIAVDQFSGTGTILWGAQNSTTGKGFLTQGDVSVEYTGAGSGNTAYDHLGIVFSTADTTNTQHLQLQNSVNMGSGALTFNSGSWRISEKDSSYTFNNAGFVVNGGANLTLELTATSSEEWRKVGEGIMTIAGEGNNEAVLRVGGGTTIYNVDRDEEGNIIGCSLGNLGETRLAREGGYAASSVRLEAGVASIVLMRDGQFKTNSVAGDTFTFGNAGGLLNLNGHDLTWGVIQQDGSGTGARIGNMMTQDGVTPAGTSTFTYTGTGTFEGCFMDEGKNSSAQLAVVYNNANDGASWTLTGNHTNVGGYTVQAGTLVLQGSATPHILNRVENDWTYATMNGSDVTVKSGAAFRLSHHAQMVGDINVEAGGAVIINETVQAAREAIGGGLLQDMTNHGVYGLVGDITLNGASSMTVDTESPVVTIMKGNVYGNADAGFIKTGDGVFVVDGQLHVPGGTIEAGGLVVKDSTNSLSAEQQWEVQEKGFIAIEGQANETTLASIKLGSNGVLALTVNQETELNLTGRENLIIGAWGEESVSYGTASATLGTVQDATLGRDVWRLGGGTGTLNVNFKLTGDADLLIGNEWSGGTVHLTNTANDFTGDIFIQGVGNKLTYEDGALGNAKVLITYGNALVINSTEQLGIVKSSSAGVLALATNGNLDLTGANVSLGANGDYTYTGALTVDAEQGYRFGGSGNLTIDTNLDGSDTMMLDGQGTTGSSVTFARKDAYEGSIVAGAGFNLDEKHSRGDIGIHVGHGEALAGIKSMELQQGATLYTDGNSLAVRNLTAGSGSSIRNNGSTASLLLLDVSEGANSSIADGVLNDLNNSSALHLVKTGSGTLTMGTNASWAGGLTISQGTVVAKLTGSGGLGASGGIGAGNASITIEEGGTLQLQMARTAGENNGQLGATLAPQTILGKGTVVLNSGGEAILMTQSAVFNGTVHLQDNTRLYVGKLRYDYGYEGYNNLQALSGSTIQVDAGSQAKVTNSYRFGSTSAISTNADFIISGNGYSGQKVDKIYASSLTAGALSIDNQSTVYGNITLADDAMIASSSRGTLQAVGANIFGDSSTAPGRATYGVKNHLGGIIRGRILGEGKTLTFGGNEGMTITADSANTFGNLVIASSNGNNDDKFALRLNGGKAVSQISTALGMGQVSLNDGLILRLAGTGTANQTDVVYTYANNINAGNGATLQSYNITNKLTGAVTAAGDLNLATANGGVLHLAGGVVGSGALNLGAGSQVILGAANGAAGASFTGNIVAGAGAALTLESPTSVATTSTITGTDSFALSLSGTSDYTLGGISVGTSEAVESSALTLRFDFSQASANESAILNADITAGTTTIALDLNMFNEIASGEYTLISGNLGTGSFALDASLSGRFSYRQENGKLILVVGGDDRLYWSSVAGTTQDWNAANWQVGGQGNTISYSGTQEVVLSAGGLSEVDSREMISVNEALTVGRVNVSSTYGLEGSGSVSGTKLVIGADGDMQLGVNSAFSEDVLVNDGTLRVSGATLAADITAENNSDVVLSGASLNGNISLTGSEADIRQSAVNGNITVNEGAALSMTEASLRGEVKLGGDTRIIAANNSNGTSYATAKISGSFNTADGNRLSVHDGPVTLDGKVSLDRLSVDGGKTVTLWNAAAGSGADKNIAAVELGNGTVLQTNDRAAVTAATSVGDLKLTGSAATLRDQHHSGYYNIGSLSVGEGVSSATLDIVKKAESTYAAVVNLGGANSIAGNFRGSIALSSLTGEGGDSRRSLFLVLGESQVAAGASINMKSADSNTAILGLGINTASATIAGLESSSALSNRAKVFSGSIGTTVQWGSDSNAPGTVGTVQRSLTIDTSSGSNYTFYGEVMGNLNLVKSGEGKQTFAGNSAAFNGSIEILEGTLAFSGSALGMLNSASSVMVNGGTLDVSSVDFSAGSIAVNNLSFTNDSVLALGNLQADTVYNFFDNSSGTLENWISLTTDNFSINGKSLSDMGRVTLSLGMGGSFSYTVEDSWDLVWNGGETGAWNDVSSNEVWQTTRPNEMMGTEDTFNTRFTNNDNVLFNSNANLVLEGDIIVNNMTVADNVSLVTNGSLTVAGDLTVGNGISWAFSGDTSLSFTESELKAANSIVVGDGATLIMTDKTTAQNNRSSAFDNVSGTGNVVLNLGADNGIGLNLSAISGDITVATGRLQVNQSAFNENSTIYLSTSGSQLVFNGNGTVLNNDVVLGANNTTHANSGCSGTIAGVISGNAGFTKAGAGTLTFGAQNTYTGATTISGGKLILANGADYTLYNSVSDGTLEVANGTTLVNNSKSITSTLVLAAGAAAEMNGSCVLKGAITVNKGATLTFTGSGSDTIDYNVSKALTVDGGTIDFGNTRQTIAGWTLTLKNGAQLLGDGGSYGKADGSGTTDYTAAMDFNNNSTINVTSGTNSIAANMRLRGGDNRQLTFNVSDGASLDVSGRMHSDSATATVGNVVKSGAGSVTISSQVML